jgi:hypothetical protein
MAVITKIRTTKNLRKDWRSSAPYTTMKGNYAQRAIVSQAERFVKQFPQQTTIPNLATDFTFLEALSFLGASRNVTL